MGNLAEQAKRVLEVYLERGQTALAALRDGDVELALTVLRSRKAAFHNFRVIDARLKEEGSQDELVGQESFAGLLTQLQSLDKHLKDEMEKARELAASQAQRLSAARRKIGKYRSSEELQSRFEKSV